MSYSGDIALSNTFDLTIKNNSSSRQEVSMFELGSSNPNRILANPTISLSTPQSFDVLGTPTTVEYWDLQNNILSVNGDNEIEIASSFTFRIGKFGSNLDVTGLGGTTLSEILETINGELASSGAFGKYARIQLAPIYGGKGLFKGRLLISIMYYTADPITGINDGTYFTGDPNDISNPQKFHSFRMIGLPNPNPITSLRFMNTEMVITNANGSISLPNNAGIPYNQILESQNGQVLDIKSMRIDAFSNTGVNKSALISQLSEPLSFVKLDANDNRLEYNKIPTIDPYQFQNTIDYINMKTKADTYALDGNTSFNTGIQANTTIRLTCAYTQLTNLTATSEYAKEYEQKQEDNIKEQIEENDTRRNYQLQVPDGTIKGIEEENARQEDLEKKKTYWTKNLSLQAKNLSFCWVYSLSQTY
jgi:hypothetical protein